MTATTLKRPEDRKRRGSNPEQDNSYVIGQSKVVPYLFSLPSILLVSAVLGFPVLYGVWQSLYRRPTLGSPAEWVGFQNYVDMFSAPTFWPTTTFSYTDRSS